jgi:hypothetical protein
MILAATTSGARAQENPPDRTEAFVEDTLATYCSGCHSPSARAGGVVFDEMPLAVLHDDAAAWEAAVRKLRGRLMPPPGSPQPDQGTIDALVRWLEDALDAVPRDVLRGYPRAGRVPLQRMTRTEFAASVNDLLGVEIDATQLLPTEIEVDGFDNVAAALTISPAFLDQYVSAARHAARLAVGGPAGKLASTRYRLPSGNQAVHIDGLPLGTRGGMTFRHNFPADGEYRFTVLDLDVGLYTRTIETSHTMVMLIDGREVFREQLGGFEDLRIVDQEGAPGRARIMERFASIPVQVRAGTYEVVVTFIERALVETDGFVGAGTDGSFGRGLRAPRMIDGVEVVGPFDSPGISQTPARERLFVCQPQPGEERACARRILETLAGRAFRRPVTAGDVDPLMPYFEMGLEGSGDFDAGIEHAVASVLVSPDFLYRAIRTPEGSGAGTEASAFPLSDLELASRLAFFLWSQGPDEELLELAAAGELGRPAVLEAQARRMLEDPRATNLVGNFALKWLNLDNLSEVEPDPNRFPAFSDELRRDFAVEIEAFIESVLLGDRPVTDLLTASHTSLNERLARHYGIDSVLGPQFRRVELENPERWGLLGKGAMLLRTSYGDRTSPVLRGAWVLEKLMGTPPAPPPPDVETDLSTPEGEKPTTLRARLERHRSSPACNQCHGVIDPIGLALENFDAIGKWRDVDVDAGAPIDARTVLPDGRSVDGPRALERRLFEGSDQFVRALTERLLMYAVGRELEFFDMPAVRTVVREAAEGDYRLSEIVSGIVHTDAFRMQAPADSHTSGAGPEP